MPKAPSLSKLLRSKKAAGPTPRHDHRKLERLQLELLRVQQGIFHRHKRAIIAFEGFDASGKGGAIRRLTQDLDPRSVPVHPIGPPLPGEQGRHWLYRFWVRLPAPGEIAIFDRSWYGRVLVERVEELTPRKDWHRGYREIRELERMLIEDGIDLIKVFLGISKQEQLRRFEERLGNPYKQWKLTPSDLEARRRWDDYVVAVDDMFGETSTRESPWHLVPADNKDFARLEVLRIVTHRLRRHRHWIEEEAQADPKKAVREALKTLGLGAKSGT